jgi:bifunctional DNase/RNase
MLHVGIFEAMAVKRHVYGETSARPLTHDLLMTVLSSLGGKLLRVAVSDLVEDASGNGIFYGFLVIGRGSDEIVVDCRPSDAIAMAARAGCPIFVSREVLDKVAGF